MCDSSGLRIELVARSTAMGFQDYIDCPHCKKKIQCRVCAKIDDNGKSPRKRRPGAIYSSLNCTKCVARDVNEVEELRLKIEKKAKRICELENQLQEEKEKHLKDSNDLKLASKKAMGEEQQTHQIAVMKIRKKLMDRINFLELHVPGSGRMFEREYVALECGGYPYALIWAHRHILVAKSALFSRTLQNVKVKNGYKYVAVRDATHAVMLTMVNFCYTGVIQFNEEITPEAMLQLADKYGIPYLKELCDEELCKELTPENIAFRIQLATTYEAPKLKVQTMDYLKENFDVMRDIVFQIF